MRLLSSTLYSAVVSVFLIASSTAYAQCPCSFSFAGNTKFPKTELVCGAGAYISVEADRPHFAGIGARQVKQNGQYGAEWEYAVNETVNPEGDLTCSVDHWRANGRIARRDSQLVYWNKDDADGISKFNGCLSQLDAMEAQARAAGALFSGAYFDLVDPRVPDSCDPSEFGLAPFVPSSENLP
jgi:hypothetical protein